MKRGRYSRFFRSGFVAVICAVFHLPLFAFPVQLIKTGLVNGTIEISKSPANTGETEVFAPLTAAGEYATVKATPDDGYEFDKWTIICMVFSGTTTQRQEFTEDASEYTIDYSKYISKYGAGLQMVQCKAAFKGKSIRVNLDVNNSSAAVNPTYKTVTVGSTYTSLPVPTAVGASFTGWFTEPDGGTLITSDTTVTEISEHTLYAHWQALNYTLTFDVQGAGVAVSDKIMVLYGGTYPELPEPVRPGYDFKGWFTGEDGTGVQIKEGANVSIESDTVLYAYWEPATYALTFAAQGGNLSSSEKVYVVYKGTYQNFPTATKGGYSLVGWYTAAEGGDKIAEGDSVLITEDVTLYARWAPITYTIAFDGNGSTSGSMSSISATYDSSYTLTANAFSRKYIVTYNASGGETLTSSATSTYTFKNWNTASVGTGSTYANNASVKNLRTTSGTITLYAQWTSAAVTLPTPTRTGYTFAGWYTAASGGTRIGAAGASYTPTAAITLYAHWTANTYTIAFNGNGSTSGSMSSISATYDSSYTLPPNAFEREYTVTYDANGGAISTSSVTNIYTFKEWNTVSNGTGDSYKNQESVKNLRTTSGTITLYAQWTSAGVTLPSPEREGYTFMGWYTTGSGETMIGVAGASYMPTEETTLCAHWTESEYTVTFDPDGGELEGATSVSVTYDGTYPALPVATRTGYGFDGWYLPSDGSIKIVEGGPVEITSNVTAYAAWTNNVYTVNFRKGGAFVGEEFSTNVFYDTAFKLLENVFSCLDGSTFAGWKLPDGTVQAAGSVVSNLAALGSVDVTAVWAKPTDALNASGVCKNLYVTTSSDDHAWTAAGQGKDAYLVSGKTRSVLRARLLGPSGKITFKWCYVGDPKVNKYFYPGGESMANNNNLKVLITEADTEGFGEWQEVSFPITEEIIAKSGGEIVWGVNLAIAEYAQETHALYIKDVVWTPDGYTEESETFTYTDETGAVRTATVPVSWVDENGLLSSGSDDYRGALEALSGKKASDGTALSFWHDYVAGTDPNNPADLFRVTGISMTNGTVYLSWYPDLREATPRREYQVLGKASLSDPDESWAPTNSATRFFRVDVHLKE